MRAPSGAELALAEEAVRRMMHDTRALREDLELDPRILYYTGVGEAVPASDPGAAFPWNAVEVLNDSVASVRTPGNLREADRAYSAYAVVRMRNVRADPDVSCDSLVAREAEAVSAFADGWIVARVLFGGPAYGPLDEIAFARDAGHLPGLLASRGDVQLGGCLRVWSEAHADRLEAYRAWRERAFAARPSATGNKRVASPY